MWPRKARRIAHLTLIGGGDKLNVLRWADFISMRNRHLASRKRKPGRSRRSDKMETKFRLGRMAMAGGAAGPAEASRRLIAHREKASLVFIIENILAEHSDASK